MGDFETELRKFEGDIDIYRRVIIYRMNEMIDYARKNGATIKDCADIFKVVDEANLTEFIKKEGF